MPAVTVVLSGRKVGTYRMNSSPFIVGRDANCSVPIDNAGVSRHHCQFVSDDDRYYIQDLGSSNGTFLKGNRIRKASVENGDEVTIGKYVLVFEDNIMELVSPRASGPSPAARSSPSAPGADAMLTFKMDPLALRQQMEKAGAAAEGVSKQVRRAGDVAKDFDPDAPLVIKRRTHVGKLIASGIKVLGLALGISAILIAIVYVLSRS